MYVVELREEKLSGVSQDVKDKGVSRRDDSLNIMAYPAGWGGTVAEESMKEVTDRCTTQT